MKDQLEARLAELRSEYDAGLGVMADLQKKEEDLRTTLMRISGAIQVLEELLAAEAPATADGAGTQPVAP